MVVTGVAFTLLAACGGGDTASGSTDSVSDASAGSNDGQGGGSAAAVVDPAPPGRATASVDGLELSFELPGALACSISDDAITFSYRIGDNEITLGGGANRYDEGWMGSIDLQIANPDDEPGPIAYYPAPGEGGMLDESSFAVDGASMSYSGPMVKQPANDGSNPPPVDVGNGTVSATCG
jgi:hypothetical protein